MDSNIEIFPVTINHKKLTVKTRVLKISYPKKEVLYKIALPTQVSETSQCWLARKKSFWKLVVGSSIGQDLITAITAAILKYEKQGNGMAPAKSISGLISA